MLHDLTPAHHLLAPPLPLQYPSVLDSVRWSSGLPRMLLASKDGKHGLAAGAQLRLFRADVSGLKAALQAMPDEDWAGGSMGALIPASLFAHDCALPAARPSPPACLAGRQPGGPACLPPAAVAAEEGQRKSNAWVDGRSKNLKQFKPGARSIMLIFSDQDGSGVYRFPWYDRFKQWVEPWLEQVREGSP
jgi:hypothetical protein